MRSTRAAPRLAERLLRLARAAVWAGGAVLLSACVTQTDGQPPPSGVQTVAAPVVNVGAFWEYAVRDGYTGAPRGLYRYTVSHVDQATPNFSICRKRSLKATGMRRRWARRS